MVTPQDDSGATPRDFFATTHWSVVLAAGRAEDSGAKEALEQICQTYWYPLYAYVRRKGNSPEEAEDLTQEFFARLLARNDFARVCPEKGRFRAYLLAAINHHPCDRRDYDRAAKRGGGQVILSLDAQEAEERYRLEPLDIRSPNRLYERRWALALLERARMRLREEYLVAGKGDLYQLLNALEPGAAERLSYAEIAQRLDKTESAVKTEASRLRRRYGELVRAEIAQTVPSPADVDDELRYLLSVIGG